MTIAEIKKAYITKIRMDIGEALDFIIPLLNTDSQLFKDYINIDGRHNNINDQFNNGILSSQERIQNLNQIRSSMLEFEGRLSAEDLATKNNLLAPGSEKSLLKLFRESKSEMERLKQENISLKSNTTIQAQRMKIIVKCQPEISNHLNNYECHCIISDDSGDEREEKVPLRKEPGGLVVTLQEIKPTDFVQLKIKGENQEWESEYFSASFQSHTLQSI